MHTLGWLGSVAVAGLLMLPPAAQAQEEKVPLDKVPKPVLKTVKARFMGAEVIGASKETEDGKPVYEVTIKDKGQTIDVTLTPEGALLMIEREIAAKTLPRAVAKALEGRYPRATYKIVEEIIKVEKKQEKLVYYEVLLTTADKKAYEVQVAPDGKIVNVEDKSKEKEKK